MVKYFDDLKVFDAFPQATMIPPMSISHVPAGKEEHFDELCASGEYFAQVKKDGYCYTYNKTADFSYLFSRSKSTVTQMLSEKGRNVPHIMAALDFLPPNTVLLGEIYYPGKTSKSVTPIMNCLPKKAIARQEEGELIHYYIHDILCYNGESMLDKGARERYDFLVDIIQPARRYSFIEISKIYTENLRGELNKVLAAGEEGMVFKSNTGLYFPGKRPAWNMVKIKQSDDVDVVVLGLQVGTKEYKGKSLKSWVYWVNPETDERLPIEKTVKQRLQIPVTKYYYFNWYSRIEIGGYDAHGDLVSIGTISSGINEKMQKDMTEHPDKYLNQVVSIHCMSKDKLAQSLRHGHFTGLRDDKEASSCTLEEIFS